MHKTLILLAACFSLLLGLVLMDASYTGNVVAVDHSLYQSGNFAFAISVLAGIMVVISLVYHQINKPVYEHLKH